jgi:hypothetical protein
MPVTLTVQGHEEIIASLQNLSDKLQGPEVVTKLAHESAIELGQTTPRGRRGSEAGKLSRTMTEVAGPEPAGGGWWAGVGNLEGIYPTTPAPKHTIKNFLEMIRGRVSGTEAGRIAASGPKRKRAGFDPKKAWWFLGEEEKQQLRAAREAGIAAVGGTSPYRAKYWFIHEAGMGEVGIRPQGYIARAVSRIRNRIGDTITRIIRSI